MHPVGAKNLLPNHAHNSFKNVKKKWAKNF